MVKIGEMSEKYCVAICYPKGARSHEIVEKYNEAASLKEMREVVS